MARAATRVLSVSDITPERLAEADASAAFYYEYMDDVLDTGQAARGRFRRRADGRRNNGLTRSELVTTLIGFLVASYHTTKVAMTNTVLALLSHDGERARLMAQPDLARNAWEESLRYDSPVHFIHRYASETRSAAGTSRGPALLGLHAASRDEARFPQADRYQIDRPDNRHLAFAGGGHFCLGSQLSRLEGDVLLRTIFQRAQRNALRRVPDLTFDAVAHDGRAAAGLVAMSQLTAQILSGMCCGFGNCAALCPKSSRLTTTATGPGSCPARPGELRGRDRAGRQRVSDTGHPRSRFRRPGAGIAWLSAFLAARRRIGGRCARVPIRYAIRPTRGVSAGHPPLVRAWRRALSVRDACSCPARRWRTAAEIAQAASECPTQAIHVVAFEDQARASHG